MKSLTIAGNIGKSAETRRTPNGDAVTSWSLAVEERKGSEKRTIWFDCSLWGKRGEALSPHLTRGSSVTVCGDLSTREHNGKTYLTIRVSDVTLQGGKPGARVDDFCGASSGDLARGGTRSAAYDLNDDVPF